MNYFRVLDDLQMEGRWFLGEINFLNPFEFWKYLTPKVIENPPGEIEISIRRMGVPLDITLADFEVPIISEKVKAILPNLGIQTFPVSISKLQTRNPFYILAVNQELDCVDKEMSEFELWEENNPIRPDKAGDFKSITRLALKKDLQTDLDLFRVKGYNVSLIISQRLKEQFEYYGFKGLLYSSVTS